MHFIGSKDLRSLPCREGGDILGSMVYQRQKVVACALFLFLSVSTFINLIGQTADSDSLQRYYEEGEKALAESRYGDAQRAYEKLRELSPGTAEVDARLGLIYFQERKYREAVASLQQARKLKPNLPKVDSLLAMSLSELGRYAEALPGLQKGFQSTDPAVRRMSGLQLARAYTNLQRDHEAVEVALKLSRLYPDDPEVLFETSRLFANYSYLTVMRLREVAPASIWMRQAAAEAYEAQGQYSLAIREFRSVLALDPNRPGIHYRLGRAIQRARQANWQAEAEKEFELELQKNPTQANAAYEAGEIYRESGQLSEARSSFETALKNHPEFEEAQIGLGRVLIALGKPDLALPHLQKARSLNPENEVCFYLLSQAYKALGYQVEQQKALAEFQRLQDRRLLQQKRRQEGTEALLPQSVTKQELDANEVP